MTYTLFFTMTLAAIVLSGCLLSSEPIKGKPALTCVLTEEVPAVFCDDGTYTPVDVHGIREYLHEQTLNRLDRESGRL